LRVPLGNTVQAKRLINQVATALPVTSARNLLNSNSPQPMT
jgi:hypothetical protein